VEGTAKSLQQAIASPLGQKIDPIDADVEK
jgi:hypothetical protein